KIELEMEKQARLEIGELLGKGRAREIGKKNLENLYLYALGERIESDQGLQAPAKIEAAVPAQPAQCPQCNSPVSKKDKFCRICGKPFGQIESLHLELQKSLPVSLSQGQKEITCALLGTNPGGKPLSSTLAATLQDSKKKSIDIDISPASADMAGYSKVAFEIKFDLKDDTPTGPLMLSAALRSGPASSNAISALANVKTPLDLAFIQNSARLGGKLDNFIILEFDNIGESGGLLMLDSHVDFADGQGVRKSGKLSDVVKVKGLEKGVLLLFGPFGMNQAFSGLSYSLAGVDSNGKPYKKEGKI
ncbi:MAG TPA: zinc ribbon domain-containing protein, partial [Candidatus Micrarchaeota archaeon]|nr:zinc ribbon domain-containing protein [Candidatus Micrarchaeota archaeon]